MVTDLINQLEKKESEIAELKKQIEAQRDNKLANLYKEVGLGSIEELVSALQGLVGKPRRGRKAKKVEKKVKKHKRARLTPDDKAKIKAALTAGKKAADVAREFGISYPTVQILKKEAGLVKPRQASEQAPA